MSSKPTRVFLGWEQPFLATVADFLTDRFGQDMGSVVVALPGQRAARRLEELLVQRLEGEQFAGAWVPPEFTTAGKLSDRLLLLGAPAAGRLERTLLWAKALRERRPDALAPLVPHPPDRGDLEAWLDLAEELRALHGTLGGECVDFATVLERLRRVGPRSELARWQLITQLGEDYLALLADHELEDPHVSRRKAMEAGLIDTSCQVVLAGVTDLGGLLRQTLGALGDSVQSLVFAPEELAVSFDVFGAVLPEIWAEQALPLDLARWEITGAPHEQAGCALEAVRRLDGRCAPTEITLGVPDPDVVPFLERRLAAHGVATRNAAGTPLGRTPVGRLVAALARELSRGSFEDSAAFLRHPDVESYLAQSDEELPVAALCDDFASHHLPRHRRLAVELARGAQPSQHAARMAQLHRHLDRLLGPLGNSPSPKRPLGEWAAEIAAFLRRVYGEMEWDLDELERGPERDWVLQRAVSFVSEALAELAELPRGLEGSGGVTAAEAVSLLLRNMSGRQLPPAVSEQAVELLGWLELPLDDAPALIISGFNEGRVPAGVRGHPFLPDGLRTALGLPDDAARVARDLHALCAILHSGREVTLITGQRDLRGDPLRPSRLAFHGGDEVVLARVRRLLGSAQDGALKGDSKPQARMTQASRPLPTSNGFEAPTRLRVSAFRDYLSSPYLYYLRRYLNLRSVEAIPREMDALVSGTLLHDVLEGFGRGELRNSQDAAEIEGALCAQLDAQALVLFGQRPLPAVDIQLRRLRHRLAAFANWQAPWRAEGWRIHAVEWEPPEQGGVPFVVDEKPMLLRGRIDRIDRHDVTGAWAVIDYKSGDAGKSPKKTHGPARDGSWRDLQLPLYRLLLEPLLVAQGEPTPGDAENTAEGSAVKLGYVVLPKEVEDTGFVDAAWTAEQLDSAYACARAVVRDIRAGHFSNLGDFPDRDRGLMALAGRGLLAEPPDGNGDGEAGS